MNNKLNIGDACMMIVGCNFIYGHVMEVLDEGKTYKVLPDLGYQTSKPFFKLKEYYLVDEDKIEPINENSASANKEYNT